MTRFQLLLPLAVLVLVPWTSSSADDDEKAARKNQKLAKKEVAFGIDVAQRGLWQEARFRFEQAATLNPDSASAFSNLAVTLEQQGDFEKARAAYDRALELDPKNLSIQQNYDLFREADEKRNRKLKKDAAPKPKESPTPEPLPPHDHEGGEPSMKVPIRFLAAILAPALLGPGCASSLEVPIETPLKSKLDVSKFRRVLVAGFVTDLVDEGIDLAPETSRLLQNQLRSASRLQVIEPDRPPLNLALAKLAKPTEDVRVTREDRDRYRAEGERLLQDTAFWRKLGEEFQNPLIVTGKLSFEEQNRSGFQQESALVRNARGQVREVRGNRYAERKAFNLSADFSFIDGATGRLLHKERFSEEVVYGEEQKVSPLSSYFELMDRLLPNFLGVIAPQRIRGTRVLLP